MTFRWTTSSNSACCQPGVDRAEYMISNNVTFASRCLYVCKYTLHMIPRQSFPSDNVSVISSAKMQKTLDGRRGQTRCPTPVVSMLSATTMLNMINYGLERRSSYASHAKTKQPAVHPVISWAWEPEETVLAGRIISIFSPFEDQIQCDDKGQLS